MSDVRQLVRRAVLWLRDWSYGVWDWTWRKYPDEEDDVTTHDHACCPPDDCCGGPCAAHPHWELTT